MGLENPRWVFANLYYSLIHLKIKDMKNYCKSNLVCTSTEQLNYNTTHTTGKWIKG
jgi:hypothetical protein